MAKKMSDHTGTTIWDVREVREGTYTGSVRAREGTYTASCDYGIIEIIPGREGGLFVRSSRNPATGDTLGAGFTVNRISYNADCQLTKQQDGREYMQYLSMTRLGAAMRDATDSARAAFNTVVEAAREALLAADPFAFDKYSIRDAKDKLAGYVKAELEATTNAARMRCNVERMEHALRVKQEVLRTKAEEAGE